MIGVAISTLISTTIIALFSVIIIRKKLKWNHESFEIPKKILRAWKEIGSKGEKEENKQIWDMVGKLGKVKKEDYESVGRRFESCWARQ